MNLTRDLKFDYRAVGDDAGSGGFEGVANMTCVCDRYGTIFAPGAFTQDIDEFRANGFVAGLNHNHAKPIGRVAEAREDGRGLYVRADLMDYDHAQEVRRYVRDGLCKFLSIGFRVVTREYLQTLADVQAWWRGVGYAPTDEDQSNAAYGAVVFTRAKVYEVSPVMIPGNAGSSIAASRSGPGPEQPLSEHLTRTLDDVAEMVTRLESVAALRAEKGQTLSPLRMIGVRRLAGELQRLNELINRPDDEVELARAMASATLAMTEYANYPSSKA